MATSRADQVNDLVADAYIRTARPVASRTVARALGVSSATVRNEFAALEDRGLLTQPHPSAGRLPTPLGFRRYALRQLPPRPLAARSRKRAVASLGGLHGSQRLRALTMLASELSGYAVVLELHVHDRVRALEVHLTPLGGDRLLAVAVLENGLTRDLTVTVDPPPEAPVLDEAERTLRALALPLAGMPRALHERAVHAPEPLARTLRALADAWPALHPVERITHGLDLLFDEPESRDPGFLRRAARTLEHGLPNPVGEAPSDAPPELAFEQDVAMIAAPWRWSEARGRLTLVGPTRMRYGEAFSVAHGLTRTGGGAARA